MMPMDCVRTIVLSACLLLPVLTAAARTGERQYIFRSIDVDDGLSQNSVMDIIQDRTGFVWFGTKDGLNRYDGLEIRRFSPVDGIPGNEYVTSLCEDTGGKIWVGTSAGLCVYDPECEKEKRFLLSTADGRRVGGVNTAVMSPSGQMWFVSEGAGIFRYDETGGLVLYESDSSGDVSYTNARNLCFNARGGCYIDIGDGNIWFSGDGLNTAVPMFGGVSPFAGKKINRLEIISYSNLFVCTVDGLYCVNLSKGDLQEVDLGMDRFRHVHDIVSNSDGEIWVGSDTGIVILDKEKKVLEYMLPEWGDFNSPKDISTYCFCLDREGGLWSGTYFGGVGYYPKDCTHIRRYYPISYSEPFGQRVREIVAGQDGTLWVGTEDRGLVHFFPESGEYIPVRHPDISYNIHGLCLDGRYLWIGTYDRTRGLVRYDTVTGDVRRYPSAGYEIYSICRRRDGTVIIGTTSGLKRFDPDKGRFVPDTAVASFVNDIFEDTSGNLWVATNYEGLYMQDALSSEWSHFRYSEQDPSSLAADMVLSVFEDSRARIWITTQGGGLCRFLPDKCAFRRYDMVSEIPFSTIYRIEEDANGIFWLTTNNGLVKYEEKSGKISVYTVDDGLLSNQFNYSSSCIDTKGRIWAGCIKGLMSFEPSSFTDDTYVPQVVFTSLSIYDRPVDIGAEDSPLERSLTLLDTLVLPASQSTFSIKVSAMDFRSPRQPALNYMLDGYDPQWYSVDNGTISYTRLSPGKYRLRVRSDAGDASERELYIRIRPPFWMSVWAFVFYLLVAAGTVMYLLGWIRSKHREEVERMEQEKIRELYVAKFEFFTSIAHEIRTPLSLISGPVESLRKDFDRNDRAALDEDLNLIGSNAERLTELINQLLDFRKAEQGGFTLNMSEYDIPALVRDVFGKFYGNARHSGIDMTLRLPEKGFKAVVDREAVTKILYNMLSNASKYAKSYAVLEVVDDSSAGEFRIILTNDGKIIPSDMREDIFHPFVQYRHSETPSAAGTGIGLSLARSLAELHHGTLKMDNDCTVNRFICTLPLSKECACPDDMGIMDDAVSDAQRESYAVSSGRRTVLVVEDSQDMQSFIVRQLSETYNVAAASDGLEAKSMLEREDRLFDIVVSDVMMPGMDGYGLCGWIKNNLQTSHIPVILLTAKTDISSKITGLDNGADAYIEKPFSVAYLLSSVGNILENRDRLRKYFASSPFCSSASVISSTTDEKFLSDLDAFIMKHIDNPDLSVSDMADAVCMSSSNLFRKLKGAIGMAPVEYLQRQRLKRAASLLLEYRYTIADVSMMTGFSSNTYFTSCFKKQFGCTPSAFIKENKQTVL